MNQTEVTREIQTIASVFSAVGWRLIFEVLAWIHKNLQFVQDERYKKEHFRTRTTQEILESKKLTGCTDYALVFLSLVRARGYDARYVEAIETVWLEQGGDAILGHVFVEVLLDGAWVIVDPQGATMRAWYGKRYAIYAKGKDSWDIGIRNFDDLKKAFVRYREDFISRNDHAERG